MNNNKTIYRGSITVGYRADGTPIRRTVQCGTLAAVIEQLIALRVDKPAYRGRHTMQRVNRDGMVQQIALHCGKLAYRGSITVGYRADGTPIRRMVQHGTHAAVIERLIALRTE